MVEEDVPQAPLPDLPRFRASAEQTGAEREGGWSVAEDYDDLDIEFDDFVETPLPDDPAEALWDDGPGPVDDAAPAGPPRRSGLLAAMGLAVIAVAASLGVYTWRARSTPPPDQPLATTAPVPLQVAVAPVESAVLPAVPPPTLAAPETKPVSRAVRPRKVARERLATRRPAAAMPPMRSAEQASVQAAYSTPLQPRVRAPEPAPVAAAQVLAPPPEAPESDRDPCYFSKTRADRVVCTHPALVAIDRRLTRTYEAALSSSAHSQDLQAEQLDWLRIRERAARRSPQALEAVYLQRLQELQGQPAGDRPEAR